MPIYEYDCPLCHNPFESLIRSWDPVRCPRCGCIEVERRFPLPAQRRTETQGGYSTCREEDRKAAKRERVSGMLERQEKKLNESWVK